MGKSAHPAEDLRGASRLTLAAIAGIVDVVEAMHGNISTLQRFREPRAGGRTRGITGLVYGGIRGVVGLVDGSLDALLRGLGPLLGDGSAWPGRAPFLAALNGVLGDYLDRTDNPLAVRMSLHVEGLPHDRIAVFIHGLCMDEAAWRRNETRYDAALARLGYTPVFVRYNTGRSLADNGRDLARQLEALVAGWPIPVSGIALVGHSMGGLVARTACDHAERARLSWRPSLRHLVFLGTPHNGAPLERGGNWIDMILGISPYTAPLSRIGRIRSAGITDLREGIRLPLPKDVACHAVAAAASRKAGKASDLVGDGLVPVASALGRHDDPARDLGLAPEDQAVVRGLGHLDLLGDERVRKHLERWLGPAAAPQR